MTNGNDAVHPEIRTIIDYDVDAQSNFNNTFGYGGITKREEFAKAAMQGLLSGNATYNGSTGNRHMVAADALAYADALIAELSKEQTS